MNDLEFFNANNELRRMWLAFLIDWQDVRVMEDILLYECTSKNNQK